MTTEVTGRGHLITTERGLCLSNYVISCAVVSLRMSEPVCVLFDIARCLHPLASLRQRRTNFAWASSVTFRLLLTMSETNWKDKVPLSLLSSSSWLGQWGFLQPWACMCIQRTMDLRRPVVACGTTCTVHNAHFEPPAIV